MAANRARRMRDDKGFTLIELLVVIVILGILAAVVVFAVGGITDKGETSACAADKRTVRTAQEAFYAESTATPPAYAANEAALVAGGFLAEESTLYDTAGAGATYTVTPEVGSGCT